MNTMGKACGVIGMVAAAVGLFGAGCTVNTVEGPAGHDATCPQGHCTFEGTAGETSNFTCSGGGCSVHCGKGAHCNTTCSGGGCTIRCDEGASCVNTCSGSGCDLVCAPGTCTNG